MPEKFLCGGVDSYPLSSQAPTHVEVELGSDNRPDEYRNTERISLVSSFLSSLFTGTIAPIDLADANCQCDRSS